MFPYFLLLILLLSTYLSSFLIDHLTLLYVFVIFGFETAGGVEGIEGRGEEANVAEGIVWPIDSTDVPNSGDCNRLLGLEGSSRLGSSSESLASHFPGGAGPICLI